MPREVAYAYLVATAEAWPFASEAAHKLCTLCLERGGELLFAPDTHRLAAALESCLRLRAAGLSLDVLRQLCDHAWFDNAPPERPLAEVLHCLAERTLEPCGTRVVLRRDKDLAERLRHFRWLSLLLPADLLIAACCVEPPYEPTADRPSLSPPELTRLLEDGEPAADTHLHLGAALHFGMLWTGLMGALIHDAPSPKDLPSDPDPPPFGSQQRFLDLLLAAAIARTQLAAFLWRRELLGHPSSFREYLTDRLPRVCERLAWPSGPRAAERQLRLALGALVTGTLRLSRPDLTTLYRALVSPSRLPLTPPPQAASPLAAIVDRDPLSRWLRPGPGLPLPETRFAHRALRYLRRAGRDDSWFAMVFWQYQRVRNQTYQYLTQQPGTAGLDWFTRHYQRLSPLRAAFDEAALMESALALATQDVRLGALEVRTWPAASWFEVRTMVRRVAAQARDFHPPPGASRPEIALILHFIKARTGRAAGVERLHADPRSIVHGTRYGRWAYERLREALAIERALTQHPELLLVLRGIDIASTELAVPTWAALPAMLHVRNASRRVAAQLARRRPRWRVPPLQATCHAGEDYQRLVEGLRRVHEPIEFRLLGPGDRLGHAISLGHDPERWALAAREIPQPAEERLDDLLWELDRYASGDLPTDSSRYAFVRAEVLRIGREIYRGRDGAAVDVELLLDARRLRHDPRVLQSLGFPFLHPRPGHRDPATALLHRYLTDTDVFRRGQRIERVRATEGEVAFLRAVQAWLRGEIARLAITVESNPSSNLLIGDLLAVEEHPSFRMRPLPGRPAAEGPPVLLSLNTDDPLTFSTALADEYAHIYGALLRSRVSAADALAWLGERRDHGYRGRFTLAASAEREELARLDPGSRG